MLQNNRLSMFYTKKRTDFLPARLIDWVLNFLEKRGSVARKKMLQGFDSVKKSKMSQMHLRKNLAVFCPLKPRKAPKIGALREVHLFCSPILVDANGLEPPTSCVWSRRSNQLSYASENGADEGTWTPDLLITNQLLYQLSHISKLTLQLRTNGIIPHFRSRVKSFENIFQGF